MAVSAALGRIVAGDREVVKLRRLPIPGRVLVKLGAMVAATDAVAVALLPGPLLAVSAAALLGCEPAEACRRLSVAEGDTVAAGDLLGRGPGIWGLWPREVRAPAAGVVERISPATGQLTLRGASRPLEVLAHVPGVIAAVEPAQGADIACRAAQVQGVYGVGGEARGPLAAEPAPGVVWVLPEAGVADLQRASAAGVAAVVAGGAPHTAVLALAARPSAPVLVLTEGFGALPMAEPAWRILTAHLGREASVDGTTQIRAGVVRPEVVVPLPGLPRRAGSPGPPPGLRPGVRVRIVRDPWFGARGRVLQLPAEPRAVESEAVVPVLVLALDGGGSAVVPRANVEVEG